MQKSAAIALFVGWEEVFVTNEKGRNEVHYFLKRKDGGSDLAVVGKERRLKHMSYYYALRNRSVLLSLAPSSSLVKLRSRKDVVDWLSSVVTEQKAEGGNNCFEHHLLSKKIGFLLVTLGLFGITITSERARSIYAVCSIKSSKSPQVEDGVCLVVYAQMPYIERYVALRFWFFLASSAFCGCSSLGN